MRKIVVAAVAATFAFAGAAVAQEKGGLKIQQSSNPNGVQIQGNTNMNTNAKDINTIAIGKGNVAETSIGSIRGGTQIQGNTNMNTNAKDVNTIAIGKGNTAETSIGSIGK